MSTVLERLKPFISDEPSTWLEDAKKRQRNRWWTTPRDYFMIYVYYKLKRKIKKYFKL